MAKRAAISWWTTSFFSTDQKSMLIAINSKILTYVLRRIGRILLACVNYWIASLCNWQISRSYTIVAGLLQSLPSVLYWEMSNTYIHILFDVQLKVKCLHDVAADELTCSEKKIALKLWTKKMILSRAFNYAIRCPP